MSIRTSGIAEDLSATEVRCHTAAAVSAGEVLECLAQQMCRPQRLHHRHIAHVVITRSKVLAEDVGTSNKLNASTRERDPHLNSSLLLPATCSPPALGLSRPSTIAAGVGINPTRRPMAIPRRASPGGSNSSVPTTTSHAAPIAEPPSRRPLSHQRRSPTHPVEAALRDAKAVILHRHTALKMKTIPPYLSKCSGSVPTLPSVVEGHPNETSLCIGRMHRSLRTQ